MQSRLAINENLSRKVEGLDPAKPWQPVERKGATFNPIILG